MVAPLPAPPEPPDAVPVTASRWTWSRFSPRPWLRLCHRDEQTPAADHRRGFGPLHRLDPHEGDWRRPSESPTGRTAIYLSRTLATALAEVFYDVTPPTGEVVICPRWHLAGLRPAADASLVDLRGEGAMSIGALPSLTTGAEPRDATQAWARAIHRDLSDAAGAVYPGAHDEGDCLVLWERGPELRAAWEEPLISGAVWPRVLVDMTRQRRIPVRIPVTGCPRCLRLARSPRASAPGASQHPVI